MKHTPGPWETQPNGGDDPDTRKKFVCIPEGDVIAECYDMAGQEEANARLLAAAPELLEALKVALVCAEMGDLPQYEAERFRAAISKAEEASP